MSNWLRPGQTFLISVNQGDREAVILAIIGDEALIEYLMPAGSTALQIVTRNAEQRGKSVSYHNVPTKWLREIVDGGVEWEGNPQSGRKPQTAAATLAARCPQPLEPLPTGVHSVGCACESCSATYEREAWDPRMGER